MRIKDKLLEPYTIEDDGTCVTLFKTKTVQSGDNKGAERTEPVGFYSSVSSAITACARIKVADSESLTLREYLEELRKLTVRLENTVKQEI